MTDPDNISGGYGGLDMEPIWQLLFFITLALLIIAIIYAIYLKYKLNKYQEIEDSKQVNKKEIIIEKIKSIKNNLNSYLKNFLIIGFSFSTLITCILIGYIYKDFSFEKLNSLYNTIIRIIYSCYLIGIGLTLSFKNRKQIVLSILLLIYTFLISLTNRISYSTENKLFNFDNYIWIYFIITLFKIAPMTICAINNIIKLNKANKTISCNLKPSK